MLRSLIKNRMSHLLQTRSGVEMRPRVNTGGKGGLSVPGFPEEDFTSSRRCEADNRGSAFSVLLKQGREEREKRARRAC